MTDLAFSAPRLPLRKRLWRRMRTRRFVLTFLILALATSLLVNVVSILGVRAVIEPPSKGQLHELMLQGPLQIVTNVTDTVFEETVDELSGGVIPVILFPNATNFCGDPHGFDMVISACVDRFNPIYIAMSEDFQWALTENREAAEAAGKTGAADSIELWERHIAAHEFAHILQYNFRETTLDFQKEFRGGFLGRAHEDMAECYAQLLYPMEDSVATKKGESFTLEFYGFSSPERFALCTPEQLETVGEWLDKIPYPREGKPVN